MKYIECEWCDGSGTVLNAECDGEGEISVEELNYEIY